jgi:hypothetical protein
VESLLWVVVQGKLSVETHLSEQLSQLCKVKIATVVLVVDSEAELEVFLILFQMLLEVDLCHFLLIVDLPEIG